MNFEDLFCMKEFRDGKLLTGRDILSREITGAHVIEIADGRNWAGRGELVFTSGVAFQDKDEAMKLLMKTVATNAGAGIVVEIGRYIDEIPQEWIRYAAELNIPLMTLPFDVPVTNIIGQIYHKIFMQQEYRHRVDRFLYTLISGDIQAALPLADDLGYDDTRSHVMLCICCRQTAAASTLRTACQKAFTGPKPLLTTANADGIWGLFELSDSVPDLKQELKRRCLKAQELLNALENHAAENCSLTLTIGCSTRFRKLEDAPRASREAKKASKVLAFHTNSSHTLLYDDLGIYHLLFAVQDKDTLSFVVQQELGALIRYDDENHTELTHTLETYLACHESIRDTSEALFVHRNTIKYRIHKICEILGYPLTDADRTFNLRLAFIIRQYLTF